jgi:heat shock protein HtpX
MSPQRRHTTALAARLFIATILVGTVSLTVALTAAFVTGLVLFVGLLVVAYVSSIFLLPVFGDSVGNVYRTLWVFSQTQTLGLILASGILVSFRLYLQPVRDEIRAFEGELGSTGDLAEDRHPEIASTVHRLTQQANIQTPEVRIVNRRRPESYALDGPEQDTIVITRGVIRQLDDDELEAVLAHEVSHLANRDRQLIRRLLVPMLVAEHIGTAKRPKMHGGHMITGLTYFASLLGWACVKLVTIVQLLLCQLGVTVLSRGRELAADRGAAELTGSPAALASALQTLDDARRRPDEDKRDFRRTASVLDILPVSDDQHLDGPLDTHPRTETRIDRLEAMVGETEQ